MAQRFYNDPAGFGIGYPIIGANSITFSEADPVYIDTSGFLAIATTSSKILGFSNETIAALASDNQTVAKVCPKYVYATGVLVVYPFASSTAAAQTNVGEYAVLSGTTSGSITLNTSTSATVGQLFITGINPNNEGSTTAGSTAELSECVVKAAFRQDDLYASS